MPSRSCRPSRQIEMDSREKQRSDATLKKAAREKAVRRLSLNGEFRFAEEMAQHMTSGQSDRLELAGFMLGASPRMHKLVAKALEGKTQTSATRTNIVAAWYEAWLAASVRNGGFNAFALPTLREVIDQFVRKFDGVKCPADWTFRDTLNDLPHLRLRKDKVGRPNGRRSSVSA
jgi:hypothetical protein